VSCKRSGTASGEAESVAPASLRDQVRAGAAEVGEHLGFVPRANFDYAADLVSPGIAEQLLAVLRESLSNALRHAQATAIDVTVAADNDLVLTVADDGIGPPRAPGAGNGLRNMATRAQALGGRCQLRSRTPRGTIVEWRVPLRQIRS